MTPLDDNRRRHWQTVYRAKSASEVSWFQQAPELSLDLIRRTRIGHDAAIVDIGGGASTLADRLLDEGFSNLTVLDVADAGLEQTQQRLGDRAQRIEWIVADVTAWRPPRSFSLWHDRAVLHFLTDPDQQHLYAQALRTAVPSGGWAVIAGFAPGGPAQCSGLDIVQHDAESLSALLGESFALMETHGEIHLTPHGREQAFRYHLYARK